MDHGRRLARVSYDRRVIADVTTVLWDADGVLQRPGQGWLDRLVALGGPDFPAELFAAEATVMAGGSFLAAVTDLVASTGRDLDPAEVVAVWEHIELDPAALALVDRVRASGIRCVLATNQHDHRFAVMRDRFGYRDRMDSLRPSCELGAAKPDPAYFTTILELEGITAEESLFIDDKAANVEAAQSVGIHGTHHDPADGVDGLTKILQRYGIAPA